MRSKEKKNFRWLGFGLVCLLVFIMFASLDRRKRNAALDILPKAWKVDDVLHFEEDHGWGPGGNDSIVAIYRMPEDMVDPVSTSGASYLSTTTLIGPTRWDETPIPDSPRGLCGAACGELPRKALFLMDRIVRFPGSYYGRYNKGFLVASPKEKVVMYLYVD